MKKMMEEFQQSAGENKVRFVLTTPIAHEELTPPSLDSTNRHAQVALYAKAIQELASKREAAFVDLFEFLDNSKRTRSFPPITEDGIHLTAYGYRRAAEALAASFGWEPRAWRIGIT